MLEGLKNKARTSHFAHEYANLINRDRFTSFIYSIFLFCCRTFDEKALRVHKTHNIGVRSFFFLLVLNLLHFPDLQAGRERESENSFPFI
jgi:hypothetical protein